MVNCCASCQDYGKFLGLDPGSFWVPVAVTAPPTAPYFVSTGLPDLPETVFGPAFLSPPDSGEVRAFEALLGQPQLSAFFRTWLAACPETGGVADKRSLSPVRLKSYLDLVGIFERIDGERDMRVRLAGTRWRDLVGRELTGLTVRQMMPRDQDVFDLFWTPLLCEGRPRLDRGRLAHFKKDFVPYEVLHVPAKDGQGEIRFSFAVVCFLV